MNEQKDENPQRVAAHFMQTSESATTESFHPAEDASHLQTLYPAAKTADELHQDDLRRQKMFKDRLPRFFRFKIAVSTSLAFAFLLSFSVSFGSMWDTGETGVVFQSFGLGLILAFVIWLCVRYISKIFYTFGRSPRLFGFAYAGAVFMLYAVALAGLFGSLYSLLGLTIASGVHFVATAILLTLLLRPGA